jgi:hypothetical protein
MLDSARPAELLYYTPDYEVIRAGRYVLCAVSGDRIAIEDLVYWSARHQEAYRGAEEATAAALAGGAKNIKAPAL